MKVEELLIEWEEHCRRAGIDLSEFPTPDYSEDMRLDLGLLLASFEADNDATDKEIADAVRLGWWLKDIGARWKQAH